MQTKNLHPTGRALSSDRSANSFIMVVYKIFFLKFSQNFLSKYRLKSECSSCRVLLDAKTERKVDGVINNLLQKGKMQILHTK